MRGALRIGISAAALLSAAAAWPATGAEDCTAIESAEARLACYDRQHGRSEPAAPERRPCKPCTWSRGKPRYRASAIGPCKGRGTQSAHG